MALYTKTLHVMATRSEADAFNAKHFTGGIYTEEYAIHYGFVPQGLRFETAIIHYRGNAEYPRNSEYERHLAQFQRNDLSRGFEN